MKPSGWSASIDMHIWEWWKTFAEKTALFTSVTSLAWRRYLLSARSSLTNPGVLSSWRPDKKAPFCSFARFKATLLFSRWLNWLSMSSSVRDLATLCDLEEKRRNRICAFSPRSASAGLHDAIKCDYGVIFHLDSFFSLTASGIGLAIIVRQILDSKDQMTTDTLANINPARGNKLTHKGW